MQCDACREPIGAAGLLTWDSAPIYIVNGTAIPVGLLVGGAVRLGRRDSRSPVLPLAAAALTFLVVAVCFGYGIGNLSDDDGGYISMTGLLTRLVDAPDLVAIDGPFETTREAPTPAHAV